MNGNRFVRCVISFGWINWSQSQSYWAIKYFFCLVLVNGIHCLKPFNTTFYTKNAFFVLIVVICNRIFKISSLFEWLRIRTPTNRMYTTKCIIYIFHNCSMRNTMSNKQLGLNDKCNLLGSLHKILICQQKLLARIQFLFPIAIEFQFIHFHQQ